MAELNWERMKRFLAFFSFGWFSFFDRSNMYVDDAQISILAKKTARNFLLFPKEWPRFNFVHIYAANTHPIKFQEQLQNSHGLNYFLSLDPASAGRSAPSAGACFFLNSSAICSMVTNSTPSCFLKCSISLSCIKSRCGRPDTSGWIVRGCFGCIS